MRSRAPADAFAHASAHANLADRSTIMTNLARMYGEYNPIQVLEMLESFSEPEIRDWGVCQWSLK
ncbi:MAG: hypothetical protein EA353_05070 [Puniceicoccaceae bacterium]|nr:MAG: hypothetical protein EA353_05070 [Puniceicoccaceae bacterium]